MTPAEMFDHQGIDLMFTILALTVTYIYCCRKRRNR